MHQLQASIIARVAYKEIRAVMEKWESEHPDMCFHWDECISVNGEFFNHEELSEESQE